MLFNSLEFFVFFPIVTLLYFVTPHKFRWLLLLLASCFFYMSFVPVYILILAVTIVIDYFAGILIETRSGKKKKLYLIISILSTCLVLFIFKYFNFFNSNFASIAQMLHWNYPIATLNIILPIGLSFHTFQSLSYVIEVYRGHQKAERNFGIYSLYVMFYPQLVAGPIERPQNLLHQFYEKHNFDSDRVIAGLKMMLWGFFKKIVIADRLAILVNGIYNNPSQYYGWYLIIATVFFAFQIYCDFSGYSDIAIGSAKVMGFNLMKNFDRPYASKSISEFWKRWHISLSTWFKDYLYISLGGNRVPKWRNYINLLITFTVSGLWHGANWNYIIWGALNGLYLVSSKLTENIRFKFSHAIKLNKFPKINTGVKVTTTFILTCFAWIFFRANNLSDALYIIRNLFTDLGNINMNEMLSIISTAGSNKANFLFAIASIIILEFLQYISSKEYFKPLFGKVPTIVRWGCYYTLILMIVVFGIYGSTEKVQFIYFQF